MLFYDLSQVVVGYPESSHRQSYGVSVVFLAIHENVQKPVVVVRRPLRRNVNHEIGCKVVVLDGLLDLELVMVANKDFAIRKGIILDIFHEVLRWVIPEDNSSLACGILYDSLDFLLCALIVDACHLNPSSLFDWNKEVLLDLYPVVIDELDSLEFSVVHLYSVIEVYFDVLIGHVVENLTVFDHFLLPSEQ